jgi:prepilin-type N-terminal cleavage/methylation domain-containing protein
MQANSRSKVADGFTLVEVMMATAVMSLALVGMIQVVVSGSEMLDMSRKQTIAMQIIHGQIDNIRLSDWATINAYPASVTVDVDAANQSSNVTSGFVFGTNLPGVSTGFQCTRTATTVRTDLRQITFTVTWRSSTGRTYQRTGSTYYGNKGLYVTYQRS